MGVSWGDEVGDGGEVGVRMPRSSSLQSRSKGCELSETRNENVDQSDWKSNWQNRDAYVSREEETIAECKRRHRPPRGEVRTLVSITAHFRRAGGFRFRRHP